MTELLRWRVLDFLVLTRADKRALTRLFLETWPDMRFVPKDYMSTSDRSRFLRKDELDLRYLESLDVPKQDWIKGWREPAGWTPSWKEHVSFEPPTYSGPRRPDCYRISNDPEFQFDYCSLPAYWRLPHPGFVEAPENRGRKVYKIRNLDGGRLLARYEDGNAEQKRFADKVVRLTKGMCSNAVVAMDPIRRLFRHPPFKGERIWLGPDAIRWLMEKPNRYAEGCFRPADEYDPSRLVPEYEAPKG